MRTEGEVQGRIEWFKDLLEYYSLPDDWRNDFEYAIELLEWVISDEK